MNRSVSRRNFLIGSFGVTFLGSCTPVRFDNPVQAQPVQHHPPGTPQLLWHNPEDWGIAGKGFEDTKNYYDRLPARAEQTVRKPVWDLSRHSAGMSVRFKTDSAEIHVRYQLTGSNLAMPHMPATGVSGVDLYALNDQKQWRWVSVVKPTRQQIESRIVGGLRKPASGLREFRVYLPLYNGVKKLEIGVSGDSRFEPVSPPPGKPIVFYGTSIMQGACASRPGMAIPAILGRRLGCPTLKLGFSGNGRMEKEVGKYLCELDPSVFVIDCLPNMNAQAVTQSCVPLVVQLRRSRPNTPILLVEDRINTGAWIRTGAIEHHASNHSALKTAFEQLSIRGVERIHYLSGSDLLGPDGEATTDGSHPSDLGMVRYADAYETVLKKLL